MSRQWCPLELDEQIRKGMFAFFIWTLFTAAPLNTRGSRWIDLALLRRMQAVRSIIPAPLLSAIISLVAQLFVAREIPKHQANVPALDWNERIYWPVRRVHRLLSVVLKLSVCVETRTLVVIGGGFKNESNPHLLNLPRPRKCNNASMHCLSSPSQPFTLHL